MINGNEGKTVSKSFLAATAATAVSTVYFDTKGSDQANIYVSAGTGSTSTATISDISVVESDTVSTVVSNMTEIADLSSGTATTESNILPLVAVQKYGGTINEIQVDLRKRKRYMAVTTTTGVQAGGCPLSTLVRLTRNEQSKDTAAEKAGLDLGATNASGCMALVTG